jgi:subtilisin family serine protease
VLVGPGEGFTLDVVVTDLSNEGGVEANLDSFAYRVVFPNQSLTLSQSGFASPFDDARAPGGFNGSIPPGDVSVAITNPADAGSPFATPLVPDLYRTTATVSGTPPAGSNILVDRLKLVAPLSDGIYPIQLSVLEAADATGAFHTVSVGPSFLLQVPEPDGLLPWLVGLAFLALTRRPRGTRVIGALVAAIIGTFATTLPARAAPFVPLEWQQEIADIGPLQGERKHLNWAHDLDGNFVDDRFSEATSPDKTRAIVQLSVCQEAAEVVANLGAFGNVSRIGTIAGWVVLDDVDPGQLKSLALVPGVAGVEFPHPLQVTLDTSTRSVRSRASNTYSPNTFEDAFGFDGTGIDIAIMDSGVDDAVHNGLPGLVSGYDAIAGAAGDPDDDNVCADSGANGVVNTAAAGDDVQIVPVGQGGIVTVPGGPPLFFICAFPGANGFRDTPLQNDDLQGSGAQVLTGLDGICDSPIAGDDVQQIPVGQGAPTRCGVWPGANGVVDAATGGDDALLTTFHGTHVAGIALGRGVGPGCSPSDDGSAPDDCQGMAPGAGLVDVKVGNPSGSIDYADVLDAIDWVFADGNAEIVNMSFGDNSNSGGTSALSQAINALVANDIAVAVAAGNSGVNALGLTASASLATTVASADDQDTVNRNDEAISATSTLGPRVDFNAANPFVGMLKPDLTAHGVSIVSAMGNGAAGYQAISGTSMASPHVAGAMALLLDMRADLPPGAMKDLLKRSAFVTPAHAAAGASFPGVDPTYNTSWGFGLIDVFAAGQALQAGVADMAFPNCVAQHPDYPDVRRCTIGGGAASWTNSVDITLATDPPVQGDPNTITVAVENRSGSAAQNVVVCIEVKELGVGLGVFYTVGCQEVALVAGMGNTNVSLPWTPSADDHQCIQATIDYGFDTQFNNNTTQRNVSPISSASPAFGRFRVENPLNEPATIQYNIVTDPRIGVEILSPLPTQLGPENCPQVVDVEFFPDGGTQPGDVLAVEIHATASSESFPKGIELSGVRFEVTIVKPGLQRDYSIARHGPRDYRIPLFQGPTTDPRKDVQRVRAVFNVAMQPGDPPLDPGDVQIETALGSKVPAYTVSFPGGGNVGTELTIDFASPLPDGDIYRFGFESFVDLDGDPLAGAPTFDLRTLEGDADDTGDVTPEDVDYVRERINAPLANSQIAGADGNRTGSITGTDISFVRHRIGNSAP